MSSAEGGDDGGDGLRESFVRTVVRSMFGTTVLYGVSLFDNPAQFVASAVIDWIVNTAVLAAAAVGADLNHVWATTVGALIDAGAGVVAPLATVGADLNNWLLGGFESTVIDFAAGFGPFAPLVAYGIATTATLSLAIGIAWTGKIAWNQLAGRLVPSWQI